jgi:DNA-binding transcriptional ArsR family regulator
VRHFKAEFFKTLAHPMRIRILDALREGELSVAELQERLGAEQSTVSQHLAALRSKELVNWQREGTSVKYTVADSAIWQILDAAGAFYERQLREHEAILRNIR